MYVSGPWVKGVWEWVYESVWAHGWKGLGIGLCKYWGPWVKWVRARCMCLGHG